MALSIEVLDGFEVEKRISCFLVEVVILDIHFLEELVSPFLDGERSNHINNHSKKHHQSIVVFEVHEEYDGCDGNLNEHGSYHKQNCLDHVAE